MALVISNTIKKAAMDGICSQFNSGFFQLTNTAGGGGTELARPTFGATAFSAATVASPSVATANAMGADTSVTAGTILGFNLQNSASTNLISGNVGTSGADINVADNVIPSGATQVAVSSLQLSLQIS